MKEAAISRVPFVGPEGSPGALMEAAFERLLQGMIRREVRAALEEGGKGEPCQTSAAAPPSGYLKVRDAARHAAVKPETIRAWITSGKLPLRRSGRHYVVSIADLEAFLRGTPPVARPFDPKERALELLARHRK
jgi:excisionase family DNA binding protein